MPQKSILCYGDSNTWGYVPQASHDSPKQRYPRAVRWPGALQTMLGDSYYVIEEGLNSRTTNLDHTSPPDRNGKNYLAPCLYSHSPLDLVIIELGGNDTKTYFNRNAAQIKDGLAELVDIIQSSEYGPDLQIAPQILIMTGAIPHLSIEDAIDENGVKFMQGSVEKCRQLIGLYAELARDKNCHYLDVSDDIQSSPIDGVHYDEAAHKKCAELVSDKVRAIFS